MPRINQKGFVGIIITVIVAIVVIAGSIFAYSKWSQISQESESTSSKTPTSKQDKQIGEETPGQETTNQKVSDSLATSIVKTFCDNFFKGPPALNDVGVMQALSLLSQKATKSISKVGPSPSAALVTFVGTSDIPEQGYTLDETSEQGETATVKTTWKYSSGPVTKTFQLVKEDGSWKIDSIQ